MLARRGLSRLVWLEVKPAASMDHLGAWFLCCQCFHMVGCIPPHNFVCIWSVTDWFCVSSSNKDQLPHNEFVSLAPDRIRRMRACIRGSLQHRRHTGKQQRRCWPLVPLLA